MKEDDQSMGISDAGPLTFDWQSIERQCVYDFRNEVTSNIGDSRHWYSTKCIRWTDIYSHKNSFIELNFGSDGDFGEYRAILIPNVGHTWDTMKRVVGISKLDVPHTDSGKRSGILMMLVSDIVVVDRVNEISFPSFICFELAQFIDYALIYLAETARLEESFKSFFTIRNGIIDPICRTPVSEDEINCQVIQCAAQNVHNLVDGSNQLIRDWHCPLYAEFVKIAEQIEFSPELVGFFRGKLIDDRFKFRGLTFRSY